MRRCTDRSDTRHAGFWIDVVIGSVITAAIETIDISLVFCGGCVHVVGKTLHIICIQAKQGGEGAPGRKIYGLEDQSLRKKRIQENVCEHEISGFDIRAGSTGGANVGHGVLVDIPGRCEVGQSRDGHNSRRQRGRQRGIGVVCEKILAGYRVVGDMHGEGPFRLRACTAHRQRQPVLRPLRHLESLCAQVRRQL